MSVQTSESKGVVILGSTGSVGTSTLDVIASLPDRFHVVGLAASKNAGVLQQQIDTFGPRVAACGTSGHILRDVTVIDGARQLSELATLPDADVIVVATTGHDAIQPTIDALNAGKVVALANKESIVAAGELVMRAAREGPGELRPIDSEHSALWQCLSSSQGDTSTVHRLVLTASGGPFRGYTREQLREVTPDQALRHPNWDMGAKITIDSATLMNKGLEVIEAMWLFSVDIERIGVVIHPQSLVHSCVEYVDGSIIAQLGSHDMRLPIQYALTYPERVDGSVTKLSMVDFTRLDFERPDEDVFPLLSIARDAARQASTYPTVLSAADAVAVEAFLHRRIRFDQIAYVVQHVIERHVPTQQRISIEGIDAACDWAEQEARACISKISARI